MSELARQGERLRALKQHAASALSAQFSSPLTTATMVATRPSCPTGTGSISERGSNIRSNGRATRTIWSPAPPAVLNPHQVIGSDAAA
jgi:hypothetical protein